MSCGRRYNLLNRSVSFLLEEFPDSCGHFSEHFETSTRDGASNLDSRCTCHHHLHRALPILNSTDSNDRDANCLPNLIDRSKRDRMYGWTRESAENASKDRKA